MGSSESNTLLLNTEARLKGRYRVKGVLGSGGFSIVYDGEDEEQGRAVAIKVLNALPASVQLDPERKKRALARFRQEALLAAKIDHPNVVAILDTGATPHGQPFIIMERLYGHTLSRELLENGPMAPDRLLPLFCQALDGLGAAHRMGIVHKDLKPSNLFLVCREGEESIHIVDFGVARLEVEGETLTGSDQLTGTPQYMAPEYIQFQRATPAVDVYQMGLILSELLTGVRAVSGTPAACMLQHIHEQLDIPEELMRSPLGPVLAKATALRSENRHNNALALRQDLLALTDVPLRLTPSNAPQATDDATSATLPSLVTEGRPALPLDRQAPTQTWQGTTQAPHKPQITTLAEQGPTTTPTQELPTHGGPGRATRRWLAAVAVAAVGLMGVVWASWTPTSSLDAAPASKATLAASTVGEAAPESPTAPAPAPQEPLRADSVVGDPKKGGADDAARGADTPAASAEGLARADSGDVAKGGAPDARAEDDGITIEVRTAPCRATLFEGKKKLGRAPIKVMFSGPDAPSRDLTAWCPNHKRRRVRIQPAGEPVRTVRLESAALPMPE